VTATGLSAVLPTTTLVALAAPRVVTWCRRAGISASTYLMPLSYAAVLGGVLTVIGTSTNLVVSDLLVAAGGEPLGVFEITAAGLPIAFVGVVVLILIAPLLLGDRRGRDEERSRSDHAYTLAMRVEPGGPVARCRTRSCARCTACSSPGRASGRSGHRSSRDGARPGRRVLLRRRRR
jgi:di/tricarboxylate transporter